MNNRYKILTPTGFQHFTGIRKLSGELYELKTNTCTISATKYHPFMCNGNKTPLAALYSGDVIDTINGTENIISITKLHKTDNVYDIIGVENGEMYYCNDILSHNCFLETGDSAIDIDLLNELTEKCREPEHIFEDGHYKVWREPQGNHIYGIGVDVGEGIGKAASVVQVLDFTDLTDIHQVAMYSDRYIHPTRFAGIINRIAHHFGCPPVLIERNNIGSEVIAILNEIHHYDNIVACNPESLAYGDIRPGILSHTNTKLSGVMNLRYWLNISRVVNLYDAGTVQELKTFVRYPNGSWKKKQGEDVFDDRVMALVWTLFLLEPDVAERYYDIVETDDNGKPLKMAAYVIQQNTMFKLDPFFQQTPNAPMPSFFSMSPSEDFDDLRREGWTRA